VSGNTKGAVMAKAIWNNIVLAESETYETVEGNIYFPPDSLNKECFKDSAKTSGCPWKGMAHYYSVDVEGEVNADAAWYYPDPKPAVEKIRDHVAFWGGVQVSA
jgi:uncharacterized protein (DUF427 family)